MPPSTAVESTALRAVSYDPSTQCLDIEFRDRAMYRYFGVPAEVSSALLCSPSKGSYFNREIRARFRFVVVRAQGHAH